MSGCIRVKRSFGLKTLTRCLASLFFLIFLSFLNISNLLSQVVPPPRPVPPLDECKMPPTRNVVIMMDRTSSVEAARDVQIEAVSTFLSLAAQSNDGTEIALGRYSSIDCGQPDRNSPAEIIFEPLVICPENLAAFLDLVGFALASFSCQGTNLDNALLVAQNIPSDEEPPPPAASPVVGLPPPGSDEPIPSIILLFSDGQTNRSDAEGDNIDPEFVALKAGRNVFELLNIQLYNIALAATDSLQDVAGRRLLGQMVYTADDTLCDEIGCNLIPENTDLDRLFVCDPNNQDQCREVLKSIHNDLICKDDLDTCTVEIFNEQTEQCESQAIPNCQSCMIQDNGAVEDACNDLNPCNGLERCVPGAGTPMGDINNPNDVPGQCGLDLSPINCNDGDACTDDRCDAATGNCIIEDNGSCEMPSVIDVEGSPMVPDEVAPEVDVGPVAVEEESPSLMFQGPARCSLEKEAASEESSGILGGVLWLLAVIGLLGFLFFRRRSKKTTQLLLILLSLGLFGPLNCASTTTPDGIAPVPGPVVPGEGEAAPAPGPVGQPTEDIIDILSIGINVRVQVNPEGSRVPSDCNPEDLLNAPFPDNSPIIIVTSQNIQEGSGPSARSFETDPCGQTTILVSNGNPMRCDVIASLRVDYQEEGMNFSSNRFEFNCAQLDNADLSLEASSLDFFLFKD